MRSARSQSPEITLHLSLPLFIPELVKQLKELPELLFSSIKTKIATLPKFNFNGKFSLEGLKAKLPVLILLAVVVLAVMALVKAFGTTSSSDTRMTVKAARAIQVLNKDMSVPIKDASGKEVTRAKFLFDNVELRDEIIINGQKAMTVKGKTFLILNVKITNDYDKAFDLNVRDFVRLSINGNDKEWLAADIHNDPVSVRPTSTKTTRLGFPINETDKNLILRLGEVDGDKQTVALNFNK